MNQYVAGSQSSALRTSLFCAVVFLCLVLVACEEAPPRTFADFMEDRIAMDGTIAFCNENREETLNNIECANARRASVAIALQQERERREAFEIESERKLEAMRAEMAERERIVRETALAAARAEREAYERMWRGEIQGPVLEQPTDRLSLIALPPSLASDTNQ